MWLHRDKTPNGRLTAISESLISLLAHLNLTPQKSLQRAYQRDLEEIERWQRDTYPAIAKQAREENADIFFRDDRIEPPCVDHGAPRPDAGRK